MVSVIFETKYTCIINNKDLLETYRNDKARITATTNRWILTA